MADSGWFKANLGEVEGVDHPNAGKGYMFGESRPFERYRDVGINVRVLDPGQPASLYHDEPAEEFFLVLGGEALAVVRTRRSRCGSGTSCIRLRASRT